MTTFKITKLLIKTGEEVFKSMFKMSQKTDKQLETKSHHSTVVTIRFGEKYS